MFINKYVYLLTYSSYLICSPGKPEGNIPFKPLIHKNNRKAQELYGRLTQTFYDQKKTLLYIYAFFCTFLLVILFIYISNVIPLSSFPSINPLSCPSSLAIMRVIPTPHSLLTQLLRIPLPWVMDSSFDVKGLRLDTSFSSGLELLLSFKSPRQFTY